MAIERQHNFRQRGGSPGQEGITSRARFHHIIGDIPDKEIRDSGMPLLEDEGQARQAAARLNEEHSTNWRVFKLETGQRYLQRTVVSNRRWVYTPLTHGEDDGYHDSEKAKVSLKAVTHKD